MFAGLLTQHLPDRDEAPASCKRFVYALQPESNNGLQLISKLLLRLCVTAM